MGSSGLVRVISRSSLSLSSVCSGNIFSSVAPPTARHCTSPFSLKKINREFKKK